MRRIEMECQSSRRQMPRVFVYIYILTALTLFQVRAQDTSCPDRCVCFGNTVRCMFINLETVPAVPPQTKILDLRFNRIRDVPPGSFKGLKHLHTLLLNNNHIRKLENGIFDGLPELHYLYLYKNSITEIESHVFQGLNNLEQLYLHFNQLENIEPSTFSKLPKLERLFLHNNRIKHLPKGVFSDLPHLRRLRLDSNALICDCQMMWLTEMLKKANTEAAATCDQPEHVHGMPLIAITDEHLHCRKPEMTDGPGDVEVSFGNTVYFTCRAEGNPKPEIIWYHNDKVIDPNKVEGNTRYSILDDGTLMIEGTQISDMGVYECVARNAVGEAKARAVKLRHSRDTGIRHDSYTIPDRPDITQRPEDQTITVGETLTLHCRASGRPRPQISWMKNDLPLPSDPRISVDPAGILTVNDVQLDDRGLYRCTAYNSIGSVSDFARIEVILGPSFIHRPQDQRVVEGHSAFFTCDAAGEPAPVLRWTINGGPIPNSPNININPSGTTLSIQRVRLVDTGLYTCIAEGGGGRNTASAQLTVMPRATPSLIKPPKDTKVSAGSLVVLECEAAGEPRPVIQWLRDGIPVLASNKYQFAHDGSLIIQSVTQADQGVYQCVASNAAGEARALARLEVTRARLSFHSVNDRHLNHTVSNVIRRVDSAIDSTLQTLNNPHKVRTPEDLLRLFRFPSRNALQISRAAEVFEQTLDVLHKEIQEGYSFNITHEDIEYRDILSPSQVAVVASLSGCMEHQREVSCDDMCYHQRYRTFHGMCNNLKRPMWGASLTPLNRLVPPLYDNGFNLPRGWDPDKLYNGYKLPSAREVSLKVASAPTITADEDFTHMLMQWGQFVDHDIDFVPMAISYARFSDGRFCNETCTYQPPCFPIHIPPNDPRIKHHRCIGTTRSSAVCGSGTTSLFFNTVNMREQINELTSYVDASQIYGSSEEAARNLRDFTSHRGLLRGGIVMPSGKALLPPNNGEPIDCQVDPNTGHVPCFQAGDVRANEQLGLLSMHTLWFREHNRIATELLKINPHWDGDTIYHETRKIVGAELQHITYQHFLPYVLGPRGMEMLDEYKGYNSSVDATIVNGFATAAYRFGHALVNPVLYRLNSTFQPIPEGNLPLHKAFFAPFRIIEEGGIDPVLRGMFGKAAKRILPGQMVNTELTEKLFKLAHEVALDLAALNIQRGRDHGLNTYNKYRQYCGLKEARTFDEFRDEIKDVDVRRKLQEVYGHPDNVDLWVGGLSENSVEGSRLGPTFLCIITEQFKRLRDGDRFWYENPGVFSEAQLAEIRLTTLARVICDNSDDINQIQPDVFRLAKYPDDMVTCDNDKIAYLDLKLWAHCCYDCSRAGDFRSITNHYRHKRSVDSSFPEDKQPLSDASIPKVSLSSSDTDGGFSGGINDISDKAKYTPEGVMDEMMKMSHKMMDAVEVRIEGMEDVIRRLERQLKAEHINASATKRSKTCIDDKGIVRQEQDTWKVHDCRTCQCLNGQVECTREMCPVPECDYPEKISGICCPVCT